MKTSGTITQFGTMQHCLIIKPSLLDIPLSTCNCTTFRYL